MDIKQSDLKDYITEGGEGKIYKLGNQLLKIYHKHQPDKEDKIRLLISKKFPKNVYGPKDIVYIKGKFVGFTMEKADGEEVKRLSNRKFVKSNKITKKDICYMIHEIIVTIKSLHDQNIYIGDLNEQNILFNKDCNISFIDVDSWSVGSFKCEVAVDLFTDPLLQSNNFNEASDTYAYSILFFKMLTRLHPFGGSITPDMSILERMKKGLNVLSNKCIKYNLVIPKMADSFFTMSSDLYNHLSNIFENKTRESYYKIIVDYVMNLSYCNDHQDYYWSKFDSCPQCNSMFKVKPSKPEKVDTVNGIPVSVLFAPTDVRIIFNESSYLGTDNNIRFIGSSRIVKNEGDKVYNLNYNKHDDIWIDRKTYVQYEGMMFPKLFNSNVVVQKNHVFYISHKKQLMMIKPIKHGIDETFIASTSGKAFFNVYNDNWFLVNKYQDQIVINNNKYMNVIQTKDKIIDWGLHFDIKTENWLFVFMSNKGKFRTIVMFDNDILFDSDKINYPGPLNNLIIYGDTIYIPNDKRMIGFNWKKNIFKDFLVDIVNSDSRIIKSDKGFKIINEKIIYEIG